METTRIICDACGADITTTPHRDESYLMLANRRRLHERTLSAAIAPLDFDDVIDPPLERTHHFCDLRCLGTWVARLPKPVPAGA